MIERPILVSIAINNYNYAPFLREAIDSALNQTYPHTEVIVVDDGSTDDSPHIIASYGERVVGVLKENGGQASAINAGFAACRGEVVIFLDADDVLLPEAVERVVEVFEERPELAKVQFRLEIIDERSQPQGELRPTNGPMPGGDLRPLILSKGSYLSSPTSGNAISRRVLKEIMPMPEEGWRISADGYLANLVPFFGEVLSLPERLGFYRVHGSNNWAMREIDLPKIRAYLQHDLQKEALLREFGQRMKFEVGRDLALRLPAHVKFRLASLRMDPEHHPYPEDSRWSLTGRGISDCWRASEFAPLKKLFYSAWFVLAALSPGPVLKPLVALGLMPVRRPKLRQLIHLPRRNRICTL
jgi:glycosyltransferase involved in cell wall biosynthesis